MASTDFVVGPLTAYFMKAESTFDTYAAVAATDAVIPSSCTIDFTRNNEPRRDRNRSMGITQTLQKRQDPVSISYSELIRPSGTAGTPPDSHPLLLACFGGTTGYTNTGSTSDQYLFSTEQSTTFQLNGYGLAADNTNTAFEARIVNGCGVASWSLEMSGTDFPKLSATILGGTHHRLMVGNTTGTSSAAQKDVTMATGNGDYISVVGATPFPAPIGFYSTAGVAIDDYSGAGDVVASVATDTWTMTTNLNNPVTTGAEARAVVPSSTTAGNPLAEGGHTVTYGGNSFPMQSATIDTDTGLEVKNDELTSTSPHDSVKTKKRIVKLKFSFHLQNSAWQPIVDAFTRTQAAVVFTLGTAAGNIATVTCATFEPNGNPSYNYGDEGQIVATVEGYCLESSAGAGDEVDLTFT